MSYDRRFITAKEKKTISSLMLKKGINDKAISRKFGIFYKVSEFRNFMQGKKIIEESMIKELITYLQNYGEGYNIYG